MNRRALLATVAALGAGCTGTSSRGTPTPTDSPGSPTPPPTATPRTSTTTDTPTSDTPSDYPDVGRPPAETDCPQFDADVRRVVCWTDGNPDEPLFVRPSRTSGTLPEATFEFSLVNGTDHRFAINPYHWQVWKRVDGTWHYVAPQSWVDPLTFVDAGGSWTWTVSIDTDESVAGGPSEYRESNRSVKLSGLGGGEYAFAIDGWFEGQGYHDGTALAARFSLDGDPLRLTPDGTVTNTGREGDTVTVQTNVADSEHSRECAFVLERADVIDPRPLIAEQAIRDRRLRNTIPFFEDGVERVELVEQNGVTPPFGVNEPYGIAYDGETYRVSASERESSSTGE